MTVSVVRAIAPPRPKLIHSRWRVSFRRWLIAQPEAIVLLSFEELETMWGHALPASARRTVHWWDNEPYQPQAQIWLDAGFSAVMVDLEEGIVTFCRASDETCHEPAVCHI